MQKSYFELPRVGQREILEAVFSETGRSPSVIEKDIWLTLVLQLLFSMPDRKAMAFKGGTSLSKVYGVIKRFSEDVDITVDFRELGCEHALDDLLKVSGRMRRKIGDDLTENVKSYIRDLVAPYLQQQLRSHGCASECEVSLRDDGQSIQVSYPMAADQQGYLRDHVLVEFGGRNIIDPNEVHTIQTDIAGLFEGIAFPKAEHVVVLSPARTFWEKATLIHAQCNKEFPEGEDRLSRLSRHWYDLAMLLQHGVGTGAKSDLELLDDVIALKSVFFSSATTHYNRCNSGELNLIPTGADFIRLASDYKAMELAGMLNGHVYPLEKIVEDLTNLQHHVNRLALSRRPISEPA